MHNTYFRLRICALSGGSVLNVLGALTEKWTYIVNESADCKHVTHPDSALLDLSKKRCDT